MSDDLVTFLRARIGEDEHAATADFGRPGYVDSIGAILEAQNLGADEVGAIWLTTAHTHAARHDPARVLADIAAKRQIVESYVAAIDPDRPAGPYKHEEAEMVSEAVRQGYEDAMEDVLLLLALPYASHEYYRPEWAP